MDDKKTFIEAVNDLGSRIKAYFTNKTIDDEKNTRAIRGGLSHIQAAVLDVKNAVEKNNNKGLEESIKNLSKALQEKNLEVNIEPPIVNVPEPKVEFIKEVKEAKTTNELLKEVLKALMNKGDGQVYINNQRPEDAIAVKLTDKSSKRFYDAVMMAVTSANSASSEGGSNVTVDNFPSEYPLPAAQIATLTPPAAITGYATEAKQDDIITELENLSKDQAVGATLSSVNDSASSVTLLSANTGRVGATFYNESDQNLYLKFGATASTISYTIKIAPGGYYEMPRPVYTGVIDGIWDSATGSAVRITELT